MKTILLATVAMLSLGFTGAQAQPTTESTTTRSVTAPIVPPPPQTLSTETQSRTVAPDGSRQETNSTTYRDPNGVAEASKTITTTVTPPPPVTQSTTTQTTITR